MDTKHLIDLETKYGASNYKPLDVVIHRGKGVWVEDVEGSRYPLCPATCIHKKRDRLGARTH